jgi:methanogenic corrinoid protein MtbC1
MSLAKKELIREAFSTQLPSLIGTIARKVEKQSRNTLNAHEITELTQLLLSDQDGAFEQTIATLKAHGTPINYIVLELVPQIAKELGKKWEEDELSFAEVSIGVNRLERVIHRLDYLFQANQLDRQKNKSIFITVCPGSQHTLGTLILSNFFIFKGWQVYRPYEARIESIIHGIQVRAHQALAISVSSNDQLEKLPDLIELLKEKSQNPEIIVLLGGSLYNKSPEAFHHIQVDVKAFTPEESAQKLEQCLSNLEKASLKV